MIDEKIINNGGQSAAPPTSTCALVGKIARLPKAVREKLNRRLDDGQPASAILPWLNGLPAVKKVLAAWFAGAPINDQNLTTWRTTGYKQWLEKQNFVAELKALGEDATDFSRAAGEKLARGTASIAAAKILKMLRAIPPEDCSPEELIKIAFAVTALVQAEQNNVRLKYEQTRVFQGNEQLVLSWDKHLRGCVDAVQRALNDEQAKAIQEADIDNGEKIELLGHRLFGDKWQGREVGAEAPVA